MTSSPVLTSLTIPADRHCELLAHARRSLPREAVGLLGGTPDGGVRAVVPLSNLVSGTKGFLADPYDQYLAMRQLDAEGLCLIAIYHSHPGGSAEPSALDLRYARGWDCAHLIVVVGGGGAGDGICRAFRLGAGGLPRDIAVRITAGRSGL